jgi:4-hydroxy-3-polyprenylbenzoate decarboxylase
MDNKKIVIAVTGASGVIYASILFEKLQMLGKQLEDCCVVFSDNAKDVWKYEMKANTIENIPFKVFVNNDFYAPFASGSANYDCMIICPCSMGTLGRIASGVSNDLITRTADVMLKEKRRLILVTREMLPP